MSHHILPFQSWVPRAPRTPLSFARSRSSRRASFDRRNRASPRRPVDSTQTKTAITQFNGKRSNNYTHRKERNSTASHLLGCGNSHTNTVARVRNNKESTTATPSLDGRICSSRDKQDVPVDINHQRTPPPPPSVILSVLLLFTKVITSTLL